MGHYRDTASENHHEPLSIFILAEGKRKNKGGKWSEKILGEPSWHQAGKGIQKGKARQSRREACFDGEGAG